ncbi:hypothetical protein FRC00_005950 [Tulasnella sp. 408]|nr:hypothetical protein FRC00_005950 [Tulasnella sp. 408]
MSGSCSLAQAKRLLEDFPYSGWQVAAAATGSYLAYKLSKLFKLWLIDPRLSPLIDLPGPESHGSIIWGNMAEVVKAPPLALFEEWFENVFGKGDDHKRQRKIMNPCFGPGRIRDLMPVFYDKAFELRDIWTRQLVEGGLDEREIDVLVSLTRTTLDVIGLAGFGYEFDTLANGETNELVRAFMDIFSPNQDVSILVLISRFIPILNKIPTERERVAARSKAILDRFGTRIVRDKRAAIEAISGSKGGVEKKTVEGLDLLSVLIKANMATDVKESERMSDEEVMGRHETTATSITWLLYDLSLPQYQPVQTKLREELLTLTSERPAMEELNNLTYLDAVVRENLRYRSVVDSTIRCASKDDIIPVSTPYKDRKGIERMEFRIAAGELILIPIGSLGRDKAIWGEDAEEFNPERWLKGNTHPRSAEVPGVFSGMLTFLGGPRSCIGYRFALMEMKVLIFALIRKFAFELPENPPTIEKKSQIVTRPAIRQADGKFKNSMPLRVRLVQSD